MPELPPADVSSCPLRESDERALISRTTRLSMSHTHMQVQLTIERNATKPLPQPNTQQTLSVQIEAGWQLPSNYYKADGSLRTAAKNNAPGCTMHWKRAAAYRITVQDVLWDPQVGVAAVNVQLKSPGKVTVVDIPSWLRVQITDKAKRVMVHYHALSARHWTKLVLNQGRKKASMHLTSVRLLRWVLTRLGADADQWLPLQRTYVSLSEQLRVLVMGTQSAAKSSLINGIINLTRLPHADNPDHASTLSVISPLHTGAGSTEYATAQVTENFLAETGDSTRSNGMCFIETPGGRLFEGGDVTLPTRMTQPDISERLLTGAHPHTWNVLEELPASRFPWYVNQMPHVTLFVMPITDRVDRIEDWLMSLVMQANRLERQVVIVFTKPTQDGDIMRYDPFPTTFPPQIQKVIDDTKKVRNKSKQQHGSSALQTSRADCWPTFIASFLLFVRLCVVSQIGMLRHAQMLPVLTYKGGDALEDTVIERSLLRLLEVVVRISSVKGATAGPQLVLPINELTIAVAVGLAIISVAINRSVDESR